MLLLLLLSLYRDVLQARYLPPPDDECVGVIRFRIVPDAILAPQVK